MKVQRQYEAGVVSIMVTMIMMIVITLIVLGFAEISRNEQRNALDAQLSVQAYYAAESGINDARAALTSMLTVGTPIPSKNNCLNDPGYPSLDAPNNVVDAQHSVSYTCLLINTDLSSLQYQIDHSPTVVPLRSGNGSAFGQFKLNWTPGKGLSNATTGCTTSGTQLPPADRWACNYPILRVDLVDAKNGFARTAGPTTWNNITQTMFLVPVQAGGSSNVNFTPGSLVSTVPCNAATGQCTVNIRGLGGSRIFYLRVATYYRDDSTLTISAPASKTFSGAQATIDVTGKAQDVLRRVLVAVDLSNIQLSPVAALTTTDSVCKRFQVTNGSFAVPLDANLNNTSGSDGDTLCTNQSVGWPTP